MTAGTHHPLARRSSGILLHPTSLPGIHGIGDLGEPAFRFADFAVAGGQSLWQLLPLGPPGYGNSPYQCLSSMAGNPLLISLPELADQGWLSATDLEVRSPFDVSAVDFGRVISFKLKVLGKASAAFEIAAPLALQREFRDFCMKQDSWLEPFARFMTLKEAHGGLPWTQWPRGTEPDPTRIQHHRIIQFLFFRQWLSLKRYCNERGVRIVGDMPMFVAHDSADVWQSPELFDLDDAGMPRSVAGVPPDYFSATGQRWGNPLYRWDRMEAQGYCWWIERVRGALELVDMVRFDHFLGFEKYYAIPGDAPTAAQGEWIEGPGDRLFLVLKAAFPEMPFIAEDLGLITPEVEALRDRFELPGMRILQFAFANPSPDDPFKPHNFIRHCVVYTGTHDNDSVVGWFTGAGPGDSTRRPDQVRQERQSALKYLNSEGQEIHWDLMRAALASVANTAIFPLQDILGLGSEARMNLPASSANQWSWRYRQEELTLELAQRLREMSEIYGRCRSLSTDLHRLTQIHD